MLNNPTPVHEIEPEFNNPEWLKQAVFYEIYPQTFYDSNGDGIGDLPGIIEKLDYVKSTGANAIWLNPCFVSPFGDAGYDVADFYTVAPRYGTNEDLRRLFAEAKKRGLRVVLDLVAGHTSTDCEWFKKSSLAQRNEYTDWYVWTSSVWTQLPPGSRFTVIRGTAERNAGYIPNFFAFQPSLNYGFNNPDPAQPWQQAVDAPGPQAVRAEIRKIMKYWLDMGASGFRVDMAASLVKEDPGSRANIQLWREMRRWLQETDPEAVLLSEWSYPERAIQAGFHIDFYIHIGTTGYTSLFRKGTTRGWSSNRYAFSFFDELGLGNIMEFVDEYSYHYHATHKAGYICIPSGNHDIVPRLASGRSTDDLKVAFTFLMTMPGVPKIYYGDEIGMEGVEGLPSKEGGYQRTQVRTPMQWNHDPNAGFSDADSAQLYLPVEPDLDSRTVADQEADPESLLNTVRKLIDLRRAHPALHNDCNFSVVYAQPGRYPFAYLRSGDGENLLVVVNPSAREVDVNLPGDALASAHDTPAAIWGQPGGLKRTSGGWQIHLPGVSSGVYSL